MSQGGFEPPSSRICGVPQRDDLTTNRQGPVAIAAPQLHDAAKRSNEGRQLLRLGASEMMAYR